MPQTPPRITNEDIRARNKVRIKTSISKADVKCVDDYPTNVEEQEVFKYYCPVCLRYFNTILVSTCCQNYICRLCIGDLAKRARRDMGFTIRCTHCQIDSYKLVDVD